MMSGWLRPLALLCLAISVAGAAQTATQAITNGPGAPVRLSSLLTREDGAQVKSPAEWEQQRRRIRQEWGSVLGPLPQAKPPLKPEILATEELADFVRKLVRYQVLEGVTTDGYLLVPRGARGKLPAVVVFHPTTPVQARGVAGLAPEYPEDKWQGVQLVKRGYLVWCPRNYINTEGADWSGNAAKVMASSPGWTGMTRMTWDAIRAADFVESLPEVDHGRIGCLGHSLGAKVVLFAMAFDERYRAGVFSEGGIGLKFSNWEAKWYLGESIRAKRLELENHQILALAAPRPFLLIAGDSADTAQSALFIEAVRPVYRLLGARGKVKFFNHHLGHVYGTEARNAAENFLDAHLKPDD